MEILADGNYLVESIAEPETFRGVYGSWEGLQKDGVGFFYAGAICDHSISKSKAEVAGVLEPIDTTMLPFKCVFEYKVREFKC